jgi:ribonuclease T1
MRFTIALVVVLLLSPFSIWARGNAPTPPPQAQREPLGEIAVHELPREARETLGLIAQGGPFPYERDGVVFGNFEKRLPIRERGYYREYTVRTPSIKHRGARRIVVGRNGERYYTEDHYQSFRRIKP